MRIVIAAAACFALSGCGIIASWFGPHTTLNAPDGAAWAKHMPWDSAAKDVHKTGSGLEYVILGSGPADGASPPADSQVEVHYEGRLASNGQIFDSSFERGETATFPVDGVIPGFSEALQRMHPGDSWLVYIPAELAYGAEARGDIITANSALMFELELKRIVGPDAVAWAKYVPWDSTRGEVKKTGTGLEYLVLASGAGALVQPGQEVTFHTTGRIEGSGREVMSTFDMPGPVTLPVDEMTPGFKEALTLMRPGDRRLVRMPANLLYGDDGDARIPPGAVVIYEIEIIGVE